MIRSIILATLWVLVGACSDSAGGASASGDIAADTAPDSIGDVIHDGAQDDATDGLLAETTDATPEDGGPADSSDDVGETLPPAGIQALFQNCSELGGDRNIYDLQDPQCPNHINYSVGQSPVAVVLTGVVVTGVFGDTLFVQEEHGGAYSGIAVYTHGEPTGDLIPGDRVTITGDYWEFYETSQVHLDTWEVTSTGEPLGAWTAPHPAHLASGDVAEMLEGVFVRVLDVETTHTWPDCPQDYGEFEITGGLRIDDMGVNWEAHLGDSFSSITGPLHYSFGNYKIEPRNEGDLNVITVGSQSAISKCFASECQATDGDLGTQEVLVTELLVDPFGSDSGQEWIELYNPGGSDVTVDGWELRDCGEQSYALAGADLIVPAGGFLVLGATDNPATNGGAPVDHAYGSAFYLPNTVGSVLLYDGPAWQGVLVDQMRYTRFDPWKALVAGKSMERQDPLGYGDDHNNWWKGSGVYGTADNEGTPGAPNGAW